VRLILIVILFGFSLTAQAAKKEKSTNFNFDELLIQGEYHFSDEITTTVEQDKVLDALLGVRKDFKDRMKRSASRY
jgi:uncharacterized membrane protein YciS (DUF1049 family)